MDSLEKKGVLHPITQALREIVVIFDRMGFEVVFGPELETEWYNFDSLNIPSDHPARDMQDTFWIKQSRKENEKLLLRTQTSPVQVRYMEKHKPPFRIIVPGRVFRNEATDSTHECQFNQLEGLYVAENVSLSELKGTLTKFAREYFGEDTEIRFRPSYFPFVEPGVEVDVKYKDKWLEILGAGLVHPKVLESAGVDSKKWKGFAFGMGIDRLVLVKTKISDIRMLYNGDLRVLRQFGT
jgi:phenylalanyl-tRNA synthetase alpha chain